MQRARTWKVRHCLFAKPKTGTFDFTLKFAQAANTATAGGDSVVEPTGPSLFTAIQEQLGLKLESAKAPVEVLVIDSVQRPSEN